MDIQYTLIGSDEIAAIRDFISDEDFEGFVNNGSRYALCAIDNDRLCGVGIFDAKQTAEILDVIVTDELRGHIEQDIVRNIGEICDKLNCDAVTMDVYDEDGALLFDDLLRAEGYVHVQTVTIYRFYLEELDDNPFLSKARPDEHIIPLAKASEQMKKALSNELKKSGAYDKFLSADHDPGLSVVCVENSAITGCVLVDNLKDEYGFELSYLYSAKGGSPRVMVDMIAAALDNVNFRYTLPDAVGYITAMNETSDNLVKKVIPGARIVDHINRYIKLITEV